MEKYTSHIIPPKVSIAPMVDVTDKHFRYFTRIMTKEALLYTEMISAKSILYGDIDKILGFNKEEGKVSLQIAASNPDDAYEAVRLAENFNYSEINLNCGCPSDRVSGNLMGAALMSSKELVYEILSAMKEATRKPITIKHRIGIDGTGVIEDNNKLIYEGYEDLLAFLDTVSKARPDRYTVHARMAILKGLNPKENRQIPSLDYNMVYQLKKDFNYLNIEINGGFKTLESMKEALNKVDAVMIGRVAYENSYLLSQLHPLFHQQDNTSTLTRGEIIRAYLPYVENELSKGTTAHSLVNPLQGLFQGLRGSKQYRQMLSTISTSRNNVISVLNTILEEMPSDVLWQDTSIITN